MQLSPARGWNGDEAFGSSASRDPDKAQAGATECGLACSPGSDTKHAGGKKRGGK